MMNKDVFKKQGIKWLIWLLCFAFVFLAMPLTTYAADLRTVVKVGYNPIDGYFMQSDDGVKSGYGYDILQKMLVYENWRYEYVGYDENYSCEEMLGLLASGDIDMIVCALNDNMLTEEFSYSDLPIGYRSDIIIVKSGNNNFSVNNYKKWNGVKVGYVANSPESAGFDGYAQENGFSYIAAEYDNQDALEQALSQGDIDIAVAKNFKEIDGVWVLDQYNEVPFYAVVNKNKPALLAQVNNALYKMAEDDAGAIGTLYEKYYVPDTGSAVAYTYEESEFLERSAKEKKVFKAIINPDRRPLSYYEDGEIKGLLKDICSLIFERSGLDVEFIVTTNRDDYVAQMVDADIVCDFTGDYGKAEKKGFIKTDAYYNSTTSMLRRRDYDGKGTRCALVGSGISGWLRENLDLQFLSYDTIEDCTQAVIDGEADFLYSYTRCVQELVYSDITNSLVVVADNHQNTDFSIAVQNTEDANLSSILTKSIETITTDDISSISDAYTYYERNKTSLIAMIYAQPVFFVVMIMLVAFLLFGSVLTILINRQGKLVKIKNAQLSAALDNAEQASRAKTDFFARMSHDMRTPMNGILGLASLSADEKDTAVLKENIGKIEESGKYLLGLINDTLDYQKIDAGHLRLQPEVISTQKLIASGVDMIKQTAIEKGVTFKIVNKNADLDGYILVDSMYIKKIFVNLMSNAVKFTPKGGTVELGIEMLGRDKNIVHDRLTVTDNGIGMSEEFLKNGIFKPFSQEHNEITASCEGTGLGLSITKQIVELMGASIKVESKLGVGTKFTVDIDFETVNEDEAAKTQAAEKIEKDAALEKIKGKSVLLAEDHPLNAQIAKKLLEKPGCIVAWAKDGKEAVDMFRASKEHEYDVILMDIRMPVLNGLEAAKQIRALDRPDAKTVPIIAVTANAYR